MLISFIVVLLNFFLIQIFASTFYVIYFLALLSYIYLFSFKSNILYLSIIMVCAFYLKYYFDENIYDFYIWTDIGFKFFYVDDTLVYTLSFLHLLFLLLVSYNKNLKKMSYN